jgi:hypothetical protein
MNYTEPELNLLKDLISDKEKYFLGKLKFFENAITYKKFLTAIDKDFYDSQVFYYRNELIVLKQLQLKLLQ